MRVFAGPNGSGKTTILRALLADIPLGVYVNADDIENSLSKTGSLLLDPFQVPISESEIRAFFKSSNFSPVKRNEPELWQHIQIHDNVLRVFCRIDSYLAADIAEFLRQQLLQSGISFTYETVMSHIGKIEFLKKAREVGYRVYLYYIATEDPEININRVNVRVAQEGHTVAPGVIRERYFRSLQNLKAAVKQSNRSYLFDNSGNAAVLISEITEGSDVQIIDPEHIPNWFYKYLLST